ncbi:MAG: HRDC domain-containing protein [Polyangiaceae bacterium]|nr:HRDC domain-containing protein [Polyangiaceae bacterium]
MKHAFFWIPALAAGPAQEELNRFVGSHRVIAVERHFSTTGPSPGWAVAVEYVDGASVQTDARKNRIDYREVLDSESFALFAALRACRKRIAEAEGAPAYTVFTNEQLAAIARARPGTAEQLGRIEGVGASKVRKYGQALLEVMRSASGADTEATASGGAGAP